MRRRTVIQSLAAGVVAARAARAAARASSDRFDVAVIGAGVFGAWTAHYLHEAGARVLLLDAYGAANSRASSGGESRITRCSYGKDDWYTGWSWKSLPRWRALEARSGATLFAPTGVLAFGVPDSGFIEASEGALQAHGIPHQRLDNAELRRRFAQVNFGEREQGLFEPAAGVLFARRAVQTLVAELQKRGVDYRRAKVSVPRGERTAPLVETAAGERLSATQYIYACGPWLPKLFPDLLAPQFRADRAEVYFLGVPPGDTRFAPPAMPTWMDMNSQWDAWGMPELENRGFKLAIDRLIVPADPDTMDRRATPEFFADVHAYVAQRFPALADAPVVETRVCQYEMAPDEQYLLDRHPHFEGVWWLGGGSGHGFKNGPAVGEYAAGAVLHGKPVDPRFTRLRSHP